MVKILVHVGGSVMYLLSAFWQHFSKH